MTYPVTNAQFDLFVAAGGYKQERYWQAGRFGEGGEPRYWDSATFGRERRGYPVVGVSWYEAAAYAAWLTKLLTRVDDKQLLDQERVLIADLAAANIKEVRLPTDEEWTRLAGGTTADRYPWDKVAGPATTEESETVERANFNALGWGSTTPVYLYPWGQSQPHGLMDMAGNVWEWTGSWYDDKESGRVVRGGSWGILQRNLRVSARGHFNPHFRYNNIGFRLVAPVFPGS
jgi:formylglycine-generating enzyme required for sulfatase activity